MKKKAKKPKKITKFRYHYLLRMPMTAFVTDKEGGDWIPFKEFKGKTIHSIHFMGGHQWDCVNGWRNNDTSSTAGRMLTCRLSELRDAPASYERIESDETYRIAKFPEVPHVEAVSQETQ